MSKPENVFLHLATLFGLLFMIVTPAALVGDEPNHFFRAYQISQGEIIGERRGDLSGGVLPVNLFYTKQKLVGNIEMNQDVKFDTNILSELLYMPLNESDTDFVAFPNTVVYTPIPYTPQVLGILVGKIFNASPLMLFYFARIFNLLFFLALAYWAIKITPVHKWVFCLLCLTPPNVFQIASASVDAFTFGICFLLIAYFLFYAFDENGVLGKYDVAKIFILSLLAVLCKQAYIFLPFLFLIIPFRRFKSLGAYLITFSSLIAACFLAVGAWAYVVKPIYTQYRGDIPINPDEQLAFIISHPLNFLKIVILNYFNLGYVYFQSFFGQLTWLDLYVPPYLPVFIFIVVMGFALLDKDSRIVIPKTSKTIFLGIVVSTAFLISMLLYMTWSVIRGDSIAGIQGRYFIPVAPLFFLLFYNKRLKLEFLNKYLYLIVYLTVVFSLLITVRTIIYRYYV
jgi:uncharacterized membrane protein